MQILKTDGTLLFEGEGSLKDVVIAAIGAGANLSGADLRWANLIGANLSGANLSGANLSGANLRWANLSEANLIRANLSGANLSGANLRWANLSEANLSDCMLSSANMAQVAGFFQIAGIGSAGRMTTYCPRLDKVWCGCVGGYQGVGLSEFEQIVAERYADPQDRHRRAYDAAILAFKTWREIYVTRVG